MIIIAVTGTPGTGKTTYAKRLSKKLKYIYIDANKLAIGLGQSEGYDRQKRCHIIDADRLADGVLEHLKTKKGKGAVVDSHLSHHIPKDSVKECVVIKCGLKTLEKRLRKRNYTKAKIRENLDSEIFDVCLMEAIDLGHEPRVVWSSTI
jgi:adenylate kinase